MWQIDLSFPITSQDLQILQNWRLPRRLLIMFDLKVDKLVLLLHKELLHLAPALTKSVHLILFLFFFRENIDKFLVAPIILVIHLPFNTILVIIRWLERVGGCGDGSSILTLVDQEKILRVDLRLNFPFDATAGVLQRVPIIFIKPNSVLIQVRITEVASPRIVNFIQYLLAILYYCSQNRRILLLFC